MDFFSIVMFLGLSYIRPQEWSSIAFQLQPVKVSMLLAIIAMVLKYRERPLFKELFRTPHDWVMLVYFIWMIGTASKVGDTFTAVYSHFLFYLVTVQALSKTERLLAYLGWWTFFIVVVALLALASEYGFDPMNSYDLTHGFMKGRLVLNTSIFNNPNSLGHSIVPAIVMLYFLLFWKRPVFMKVAAIPIIFFPLYCIYLTLSKGAFISGFTTIIIALIFRRPKTVQLMIVLVAATVGFGALKTLPRMQEMEYAKHEEGIQGRLAAFQFGLDTMKKRTTGLGYQQFVFAFNKAHDYWKAPHSSYVQIGSELGFTGLFLFLGIFYCCLRTLITARTTDVAEERVRRILFALLISFMVSSWMVSWSYRGTFFLMVAVIAAFHRQMLVRAEAARPATVEPVPDSDVVLAIGGKETPLRPAENSAARPDTGAKPAPKTFAAAEYEPEVISPGIRWNRFGWVDLALVSLMLIATVKFWQFIMRHI